MRRASAPYCSATIVPGAGTSCHYPAASADIRSIRRATVDARGGPGGQGPPTAPRALPARPAHRVLPVLPARPVLPAHRVLPVPRPQWWGRAAHRRHNVTLGTVVSSDRSSATVLTSTGYEIDIPFSGTFDPAQIDYTRELHGDRVSQRRRRRLAAVLQDQREVRGLLWDAEHADGAGHGCERRVHGEAFTAATIDNPNCQASAGTDSGWKLVAITHAPAGLPATIATPLKLQ